MGFKRGQRT
jgi:large subunit ribosomal protein L35Ae